MKFPMYFLNVVSGGKFEVHSPHSYDPADGWKVYILKGAPGTGKSNIMKMLAAEGRRRNVKTELFPCCLDPNCLDGVAFPELKRIVLDGMSPHTVEPKYPGVCEQIISLGGLWSAKKLLGKEKRILELTDQHQYLTSKAIRFVTVAAGMKGEIHKIALEHTDVAAATRFGIRMASRMIPKTKNYGGEWTRFLSGLTPEGIVFYRSTIQKTCNDVVVISDDYGPAANVILSVVKDIALERGHTVISCPNFLLPEDNLEEVLLPELRLGFVTDNKLMQFDTDFRKIRAKRFYDSEGLGKNKNRISFLKKASNEMLGEGMALLEEAKLSYDELKAINSSLINIDANNAIFAMICSDIFNI